MGLERKKGIVGIIFALPAAILFLFFFVYPLFRMFQLSFYSWDLLTLPKFVGVENYRLLPHDPGFVKSFKVTSQYILTMIAFGPLTLILAMIFNLKFKLRRVYWGIFFAPYVMCLVVSSLTWKLMYNPTVGLLTLITDPLNLHIRWLTDNRYALPSIIIYSLWVWSGYYMTLWLAGLRGVPSEYYEAAMIDGAGKFGRFRYITWPLLKPVTLFVVIISIVGAFQQFTPFYVMTRGGPGDATRVLAYYIYQTGFMFLRMGYAATVSVVIFVIVVTFAFIQIKIFQRS